MLMLSPGMMLAISSTRDHARVFAFETQVLNFSIAYGKTAHGLAKDFGTGLQEAKDTVERWYGDRFEVCCCCCCCCCWMRRRLLRGLLILLHCCEVASLDRRRLRAR